MRPRSARSESCSSRSPASKRTAVPNKLVVDSAPAVTNCTNRIAAWSRVIACAATAADTVPSTPASSPDRA